MKVCPICKARCFDDMEKCYGCMHLFGSESYLGIESESNPFGDSEIVFGQENPGVEMPFSKNTATIPLFDGDAADSKANASLILPVINRQGKGRPKVAVSTQSSQLVSNVDIQMLDATTSNDNGAIELKAAEKQQVIHPFSNRYQLVISLEPVFDTNDSD